MRWTGVGDKICIAYDDGAVIVGSADGNRLWGKDLNLQLSLLQWSPDGSYIVFASASGECHTYDSSGNAVAKVQMFCNEGYNGETMGREIAGNGSSWCLRLAVFSSLQLTGVQLDSAASQWLIYSTCCHMVVGS
jgi:WD40 repeat protein